MSLISSTFLPLLASFNHDDYYKGALHLLGLALRGGARSDRCHLPVRAKAPQTCRPVGPVVYRRLDSDSRLRALPGKRAMAG